MPARQWVLRFLERHRARYQPGDWPDAKAKDPEGREEWRTFVTLWIDALDELTPPAAEDEADAASRACKLAPPEWRKEHIPAVVANIRGLRARAASRSGPAPDSREATAARCKGCPECGGGGMASRRFLTAEEIPRVLSLSLACLCDMGRLVAADLPAMPQLARYPDLWAGLWPAGEAHPTWPRESEWGEVLEAVKVGGRTVRLARVLDVGESLADACPEAVRRPAAPGRLPWPPHLPRVPSDYRDGAGNVVRSPVPPPPDGAAS